MDIHMHNNKYWEYIPTFVKKVVCLPTQGIIILGYFPYHTARIKACNIYLNLPRKFFLEFERLLALNGILDNKAVYICRPYNEFDNCNPFALMLKDEYVVVGTWENVINYDGTPLKTKA